MVMKYLRYFLEHMQNLLIDSPDPVARASYFGLLFDSAPTYQELVSGTHNFSQYIKLNEVFAVSEDKLVTPYGFEPRLTGPEPVVLPITPPPIGGADAWVTPGDGPCRLAAVGAQTPNPTMTRRERSAQAAAGTPQSQSDKKIA